MSINFVPIEQIIPALITAAVIKKGTTDPAVINARANTALTVAKIFTDIAANDAAAAQDDFNAVLVNPDLDPVVAFELQKLLAGGLQQLSVANAIGNITPVIGMTVAAVVTNIAAGITTAANLEIKSNPLPAGQVAKQA